MANRKKSKNVEIGRRLQEARKRLGYKQADFAQALGVTDEHYRKYELGSSGIPIEKVALLFEKFGIDPTYLVVGKVSDGFDLEAFLSSCNTEQRKEFFDKVWRHLNQLLVNVD